MITIDIDMWRRYKEAREKQFNHLCEADEFCKSRKDAPGFKEAMIPPLSIENCLEWLDKNQAIQEGSKP